jgi:hypothetical protein
MALTIFDFTVHYESGESASVKADQRDMAMWEVASAPAGVPFDSVPITGTRWLAWHALKRTGVTTLNFPEWNKTVVEAELNEASEVVPTKRARTAKVS